MPFLIASAGVFLARTGRDAPWRRPRARRMLVTVAAPAVGHARARPLWCAARCRKRPGRARPRASCSSSRSPSSWSRSRVARCGALASAAAAALGILLVAHAVRDRRWHETSTRLGGDVAAVEQVLRLSPEALGPPPVGAGGVRALRPHRAPRRPAGRGDRDRRPALAGRRAPSDHAAAARVHRHRRPRPPRLPAVVGAASRSRALPAQRGRAAADPPQRPGGSEAVLRGDRFTGQDREYEGPSFGDWPNYVALKIEYDGDYRIPVERPLGSLDTESAVVRRSGERRVIPAVHRIRIVVPGTNEGWIDWETAPAAASGATAFVFAAYSGTRGEAELRVRGRARAALPPRRAARASTSPAAAGGCAIARSRRARTEPTANTCSSVPPRRARPCRSSVRYRAGLSQEPMFFVIDRRAISADLVRAARACGVARAGHRRRRPHHRRDPQQLSRKTPDGGRWPLSSSAA